MQTKVQAYVQLADETSLKITGNYLDWLSFLTTASRLYKYPYHDQLMIYAQRPDASACAAYELWNGTMHRYIRRGAKGIALLNPTANGMRIRYVFDVSDTGTRADSRNVDVWQLTEAAEPAVRKMLAEEFSADASMRLVQQIEQLAERQALAYWNSSTSAASSFPSSSWNAPANSWKTGSPNWKPKNGRMMSSPSSS